MKSRGNCEGVGKRVGEKILREKGVKKNESLVFGSVVPCRDLHGTTHPKTMQFKNLISVTNFLYHIGK